MSLRIVFGRENVPCVAEVVNRSLKADCTDFASVRLQLNDNAVIGLFQSFSACAGLASIV